MNQVLPPDINPAAATMMIAIYPPWALEGGVDQLIERLKDRKTRERIGRDIERKKPQWPPYRRNGWPHNLVRAVGWETIYIGYVESRKNKRYENRSLSELAVAVSVVDSSAILRDRTVGLHEALRMMPGVQVASRYGTFDVNIGIRGSAARTRQSVRGVAVLLDGIPLTQPEGRTRIDPIELAAARQVEVVRGPASAIHAASSGGVVNMVSRTGRDSPGTTVRMQGGAFGFRKADGRAGGLFAAATLQQTGIVYTTAGKAGFITSLYVVIVPLMGLALGHRPSAAVWVGAIMAAVGLYFLSIEGGFRMAWGDLLVLAGAFMW